MAPTLSSRTFLLNNWILTAFCNFHIQWPVEMPYWRLMKNELRFCPIETSFSVFIGFYWNLLNLVALILRFFSKIGWVGSMYLFIFVVFLMSYCSCSYCSCSYCSCFFLLLFYWILFLFKKKLKQEKFLTEIFFNGFSLTFLAQSFFWIG